MLILDRRHHQGKAQKCRKVLVASPSPPHQPSPPCNVYGRYLQGVFRGGQAVLRRFLRALVERGCTQGYGCLLGLGRGAQYVGYIFVTFHSTFTTLDIYFTSCIETDSNCLFYGLTCLCILSDCGLCEDALCHCRRLSYGVSASHHTRERDGDI